MLPIRFRNVTYSSSSNKLSRKPSDKNRKFTQRAKAMSDSSSDVAAASSVSVGDPDGMADGIDDGGVDG